MSSFRPTYSYVKSGQQTSPWEPHCLGKTGMGAHTVSAAGLGEGGCSSTRQEIAAGGELRSQALRQK